MNAKRSVLFLVPLLALIAAGCGMFGSYTSPPSAVESRLYDVQTNLVDRLEQRTVTNTVTETVTVYETNTVGQIVTRTNEVLLPQYEIVTITNQVEAYTYVPKEETVATVQTAGGVINTFLPGIGTAVSGIGIGLLGAWAKLRSWKKTGTVLAQNIETMREFLKTLPDGEKYDAAVVDYLKEHQRETGAAATVVSLLEKYVSGRQAKASVEEIKNAISALK